MRHRINRALTSDARSGSAFVKWVRRGCVKKKFLPGLNIVASAVVLLKLKAGKILFIFEVNQGGLPIQWLNWQKAVTLIARN